MAVAVDDDEDLFSFSTLSNSLKSRSVFAMVIFLSGAEVFVVVEEEEEEEEVEGEGVFCVVLSSLSTGGVIGRMSEMSPLCVVKLCIVYLISILQFCLQDSVPTN